MQHRVQKLMSNYGFCSRRKAEEYIERGRVRVNGREISLGDKANENDEISVDGKKITAEKKIYIMFNKPVGCVTALTDSHHKTVMHYVKVKERVFPVGRLDYNTSGLLLLTNDGDFANSIMHPRHEIKKTYVVTVNKPFSEANLKQLALGVALEDGKTLPAKVKQLFEKQIEIVVHEGKNRIVRRMLEALGYKVKFLSRTAVGELHLGSLETAEHKFLDEKEKELIFRK